MDSNDKVSSASLDTLKGLGVKHPYKAKYDNYIGGKWVAPVDGAYFDNVSPVTGKYFVRLPARQKKM